MRAKEGKRGGVVNSPDFLLSLGVSTWRWAASTIRARRKRLHCRLGNAAVGYRYAPRSACVSVNRLLTKKKQVVSKEKAIP